ncbi:hypothetical protein DIS18_08295 [Algibacter marinivivus]|uniref:Uncharacterized protein n=1 Tax=Algibacter marinivivus TaxID=2100723 RepID=A0A2U2X9U2_9FLAO|nr:hypothetical protein [Algibacter marinivivus]PWH84510.1 hypothetical protein DIS18_08295 [Algibacter marinivivus]
MTELNTIISTFSTEEQQKFISYLAKKNKRNDTKNVALFKLLLKKEQNSNTICKTLYGSQKKDAYHALRKRLYESLIDFTANQSLQEENSTDMQIIKYILAAKSFLQQKHFKIAYKILDKAEKLAKAHDLFPFLNEIYNTQIQFAHAYPSVDIDSLSLKLKNNQKNSLLEDELNIVYAKIKTTLNSISYQAKVLDFQTILNNTLKAHKINLNAIISFKALYQLITISSISAFITKDYLKIEPFLISNYQSILANKNTEKQGYYHIQILYAIANTLFRNKKFKESLFYLDLMLQQMISHKRKYYNTFKLKYLLLKALNANYNNQQDLAIEILEPIIYKKHQDTEVLLDIHLSLLVFHFQKNNLKKAHNLLSKFNHSDQWYKEKAGIEWVIKKNLVEILLHIESQNINLAESKLRSFKRSYYPYLEDINQKRVITYLSFVEMYYKNPEQVTSEAFKNKVEHAFDWLETHKEDIFVISFYSWLKSKMNNEDLYKTTLKLITQAQQEFNDT